MKIFKTRPLSPVEELLLIVLFIFVGYILLFCSGCRVLKTTKSSTKDSTALVTRNANQDSSKVKVASKDSTRDNTYHSHTEKDSAVGIPGSKVGVVLKPEQADSSFDVRSGNARLTGYTDKQGNRHITGSCDSLTLIIERMRRDSINQQKIVFRQLDSMAERVSKATADTASKEKTLKEVVQEAQPTWLESVWSWIVEGLAVIGAGTVIYYIFKILTRA